MTVFNELIDFCFQGGNRGKLSVTKAGARWDSRTNSNIFDKDSVKQSLKYLMDNCYFTFGNKVFPNIKSSTIANQKEFPEGFVKIVFQ